MASSGHATYSSRRDGNCPLKTSSSRWTVYGASRMCRRLPSDNIRDQQPSYRDYPLSLLRAPKSPGFSANHYRGRAGPIFDGSRQTTVACMSSLTQTIGSPNSPRSWSRFDRHSGESIAFPCRSTQQCVTPLIPPYPIHRHPRRSKRSDNTVMSTRPALRFVDLLVGMACSLIKPAVLSPGFSPWFSWTSTARTFILGPG